MEGNGTQHIAGEKEMGMNLPQSSIIIPSITIPSKAAEGRRWLLKCLWKTALPVHSVRPVEFDLLSLVKLILCLLLTLTTYSALQIQPQSYAGASIQCQMHEDGLTLP